MNRLSKLLIACLALLPVAGCSHSDEDVKETASSVIRAYYNEVDLDWEASTFSHDGYTITIPDKWGWGFNGSKEYFLEYDPHDIEFNYRVTTYITYGGVSYSAASFGSLEHIKPTESSKIFEIITSRLDIDSKILVKDELIDDCYFKYDSNTDFYNYCYFKMPKNDVNQLKEGYYNQINVKLKYYTHIDSSYSFKIAAEKDGLNNIGYYSEVSIAHNPDWIE